MRRSATALQPAMALVDEQMSTTAFTPSISAVVVAHPAGYGVHGHAGDVGAGGGQRGGHSDVDPAREGCDGFLGAAGEDGSLLGVGQQMVGPDGGVTEALRTGVGLDAGLLVQLQGLGHEGDGLQHIEAADGAAGQMHLCAALPGRLLDLFIKREVGECTDGQHHEVHAPAQHRNGHCAHRFHRSGFHDVLRLQRQQSIHVRAGRTPHACRRLLCRSEGAAGDTHQLVVFQQALLPRIGHDIAEETTAHDAKFRFHVSVSPFSRRVGGFFFSSIPCHVQKSKTRRFS